MPGGGRATAGKARFRWFWFGASAWLPPTSRGPTVFSGRLGPPANGATFGGPRRGLPSGSRGAGESARQSGPDTSHKQRPRCAAQTTLRASGSLAEGQHAVSAACVARHGFKRPEHASTWPVNMTATASMSPPRIDDAGPRITIPPRALRYRREPLRGCQTRTPRPPARIRPAPHTHPPLHQAAGQAGS